MLANMNLAQEAWEQNNIARFGAMLQGLVSLDGTNWTLISSNSLTMATNIYIGLAVASGSNQTLNTSTFTNLTVIPAKSSAVTKN